ncbi:MAG: hypothetical protein EZS28_042606 [Streblomastix strix]|uniref:Uncharacterized protein n=1 Tax=Streblomastix strix TaxID=222440 RepID=A0A5J4TUC7_9EUKA|nr:MAG: hypothetical protein EZS28_042606 [Streblomastix strix]
MDYRKKNNVEIVSEVKKICPSKSRQVYKQLMKQDGKTGKGLVPLNLSGDVLGFAHNVTGQHIRNISKKIFIENGSQLSQIGPSWLVNPFRIQKSKSNRLTSTITSSSSYQIDYSQEEDNSLQMNKKKRKRTD